MSYASDKLYNGYLRRKRWNIVNKVKPLEIMDHLPCLNDHDRENIEARTQTKGNTEGMGVLLDCLKRREKWAEQLITALEECEYLTIAAEMRAEYDSLRGVTSSPQTAVIRAQDPPAPSVRHLSAQEHLANTQAAAPLPDAASTPPHPAAHASAPVKTQPQAPQSPAAQVPEAVSLPEPVAKPAQSPQRDLNFHQEPVENSESDFREISIDHGARSMDYVATPQQSLSVQQNKTGTTSRPDPVQTKTNTEVRPPRSPSPTRINSDVTDGSSFPVLTPERPPVQDTSPPGIIKPAAVLKPEVTTQVLRSSPLRETAAPPPPLHGAGMDASLSDDDIGHLSKPGELMSVHPPDAGSPPATEPSSAVQPYSGDSERLQMSEAAPDTVVSAGFPVSSTRATTASGLPCQENGVSFKYTQREENYHEPLSSSLSLDMQEVLENVGHISEEPSIQNLDSQGGTPRAENNSEMSKEITSEGYTLASEIQQNPSEQKPPQFSEERMSFFNLTANKYVVAAGVGVFALLVAWKFKN